MVSKLLIGGKAIAEGEFFFANIRINHDIPAERFIPRFPTGTILADRIEGKVCYIDEAGRKIREHESFVVVKEDWKEVIKPQGQPPAVVGQQSALNESTPLLQWLLYGFAAFLAVALVLWFVQRQRMRRAEAN